MASATTTTSTGTNGGWQGNQHDEEPYDGELDLSRVMAALNKQLDDDGDAEPAALGGSTTGAGADAVRAASTSGRHSSSGGVFQPDAWRGLADWVRKESQSAAALPQQQAPPRPYSAAATATPPIPGAHNAASASASAFGLFGTPLDGTAASLVGRRDGAFTPPLAGEAASPPSTRGSAALWPRNVADYAAMATPPRPNGSQPFGAVASARDYAMMPMPVSAVRGHAGGGGGGVAFETPQQRASGGSDHYLAFSNPSTRNPGSAERSAFSSGFAVATASPAGATTASSDRNSSPNGGDSASFAEGQLSAAGGDSGAHAIPHLSGNAVPFTPKRLGGAGYIADGPLPPYGQPPPQTLGGTPQGSRTYDPIMLAPLTPPRGGTWSDPVAAGGQGHGLAPPQSLPPPTGPSLEHLKANAPTAAKDQLGCRVLQRLLDLPWIETLHMNLLQIQN